MKKLWLWAALGGCPALVAAEEGRWEPSQLKDATIEAVHRQAETYRRCIDTEGRGVAAGNADARDLANEVLKKCEPHLTPARDTLIAEGVSAQEADRYLRKTRTYAARNLLRALMEVQAAGGATAP
jgi:hypothetical protein